MTGLLGGGHALYWDGPRAWNLDCFVAVPSEHGRGARPLEVPFGEELVHYAVGPGSLRGARRSRPGSTRSGGASAACPWRGSSSRRSRSPGTASSHAAGARGVSRDARAGLTLHERAATIYAPGRTPCSQPASSSRSPASCGRSTSSRRGRRSVYRDRWPGRRSASDERRPPDARRPHGLRGAVVAGSSPRYLDWNGRQTRRPLRRPGTLGRLPGWRSRRPSALARARRRARAAGARGGAHDDLVAADRDGGACVLTTSLGLGTGDFLPGYDLHLNSMLGEVDLLRGPLEPGAADGEHDGAAARAGRGRPAARDRRGRRNAPAHGARRRRRRRPRRRAAAAGGDRAPAATPRRRRDQRGARRRRARGSRRSRTRGWTVRRWPAQHHYFGGVSAIASPGPAPIGAPAEPPRCRSTQTRPLPAADTGGGQDRPLGGRACSTSPAICAMRSPSLSNARSSRSRSHTSTTTRRP